MSSSFKNHGRDGHQSGCYDGCSGTYHFGGNYGSSQPHSTDCWCNCHKITKKKGK